MGLSMGATLALRLAELRGDGVAGLVLVNPSLTADNALARLAPVFGRVVPSVKGIGSDMKKDGARELAYDRIPGRGRRLPGGAVEAHQAAARRREPAHAGVPQHRRPRRAPAGVRILREALPAGQLTVRNSGIATTWRRWTMMRTKKFAGSLEFVRAHSRAGRE